MLFQDKLNTVPWLRQLVAVLSPQRSGLDPSPVYLRFVVNKVAVGLVFLLELRFSPGSIIPSMLHTYLH